jgi:hypothetical protein
MPAPRGRWSVPEDQLAEFIRGRRGEFRRLLVCAADPVAFVLEALDQMAPDEAAGAADLRIGSPATGTS